MQFLGNFGKIVCWRPPPGVGAPTWGNPGSATANNQHQIDQLSTPVADQGFSRGANPRGGALSYYCGRKTRPAKLIKARVLTSVEDNGTKENNKQVVTQKSIYIFSQNIGMRKSRNGN